MKRICIYELARADAMWPIAGSGFDKHQIRVVQRSVSKLSVATGWPLIGSLKLLSSTLYRGLYNYPQT